MRSGSWSGGARERGRSGSWSGGGRQKTTGILCFGGKLLQVFLAGRVDPDRQCIDSSFQLVPLLLKVTFKIHRHPGLHRLLMMSRKKFLPF